MKHGTCLKFHQLYPVDVWHIFLNSLAYMNNEVIWCGAMEDGSCFTCHQEATHFYLYIWGLRKHQIISRRCEEHKFKIKDYTKISKEEYLILQVLNS